ncbi:DUF2891 domain-containing protein [Novosphingobium sp.]|uniref:DUF2891 domain-containing protein n=1 Tax=Novosphingobium sp. TaxID=1874826 RepID=UPI0025D241A1|nr:DUF2891 domain-containing protein [Novosphingobium sp.]MCC6924654.1 DUF2891 domain-containing protein [Novosphingobium sp.]
MTALDPALAARFMALTLGHVGREYPHKLDHVLDGPDDAQTPSALHPIFHGSFDWHSCVHGWWQVLRLARLYPDLPDAEAVRQRASQMLTEANFAAETAYLARPTTRGFERPYGWAWALALHGEMVRHDAPWAHHADHFARAFASRFKAFLPLQTYPIYTGTHYNSAFALTLAHVWAMNHDPELLLLIEQRARDWFTHARIGQAWEPGGDEFLSPALSIAMLMSRVLGKDDFAAWFGAFMPEAASARPTALFEPAFVSDRSDGKIAHLDGLNLSRAWCWRRIGQRLDPSGLKPLIDATVKWHLDSAMPHIAGNYMGEHWLASFALLALQGEG